MCLLLAGAIHACTDAETPEKQTAPATQDGGPSAADASSTSAPNADAATAVALDAGADADLGALLPTTPAAIVLAAASQPIEAIFLGVCGPLWQSPDPSACTGVDELLRCSREQCGLDACLVSCADNLQCLRQADDRCLATVTCKYGEQCLDCAMQVQACTWIDHCGSAVQCGAPTADGPCSDLERCCNTQNDPTACLGWLDTERMFGGDDGCAMLLADPGFHRAYADDPPCE